eukprot:EG_transcript_11959
MQCREHRNANTGVDVYRTPLAPKPGKGGVAEQRFRRVRRGKGEGPPGWRTRAQAGGGKGSQAVPGGVQSRPAFRRECRFVPALRRSAHEALQPPLLCHVRLELVHAPSHRVPAQIGLVVVIHRGHLQDLKPVPGAGPFLCCQPRHHSRPQVDALKFGFHRRPDDWGEGRRVVVVVGSSGRGRDRVVVSWLWSGRRSKDLGECHRSGIPSAGAERCHPPSLLLSPRMVHSQSEVGWSAQQFALQSRIAVL